jgi:hypothetical protein
MATRLATDRRIGIDLASLRLMLGDLPEVAQEWDELSDGERVSWSLDWDQLMGALKVTLDPYYRSGAMTDDQRARYGTILGQLKEALPLIQRLQLYPPPVPLDEPDVPGEPGRPGCA